MKRGKVVGVPEPSPRISVVLPVFRPDPTQYAVAIDSILSQTFRDIELVIVEAEPSEQSVACLKRASDSRIRWFQFEGPPCVAAQHNLAVTLARGALIARADADDICEPQRLERELAFLDQHADIDVAGSNLTVIDDHGTVIGKRDYPADHEAIVAAMRRYNPIANSTVVFRRRIVERHGGCDTSMQLAEDYDWYSRLAREGVRFANLQEPLVRYRISSGSQKSTKLRATLEATIEIKRRYWTGEFDLRGRAMYALEHFLLLLPPSWVLRLFMALRYK
jgi:glycosyltransferase involved in cell wall biosynthesis